MAGRLKTPRERKAGFYFQFFRHRTHRGLGPFQRRGGGELVSELEEDLAGWDPIRQHLENALRFEDAFRTPPSVGMDSAVDVSGPLGCQLTSRSTEELQHDAITFFSCFVSL